MHGYSYIGLSHTVDKLMTYLDEYRVRVDNAERASAAAEGRCFVLTIFDAFLFLIVCLLTFINIGLEPGEAIPWWWWGTLGHFFMVVAHVYLIVVFFREKTSAQLLIVQNEARQSPMEYMQQLQRAKPTVMGVHMWVILGFMLTGLIVDAAVYGARIYCAADCAAQNGGSLCVFKRAGVFMDFLGALVGGVLIVADCVAIAYLYSYRSTIKTEYIVKSTVQRDALNEKSQLEVSAEDDRVPASLRQRLPSNMLNM